MAGLAIAFAVISCDRRGPAWGQMDVAEKIMNVRPDSALLILNHIPAADIRGKETAARYALLKSMALDKNYIDTTSFDILRPAIDYYLKKGNADEKLRTYYYQGVIYDNRHDDDSAMQCFIRGREFFDQATDSLTMGNLLVAKAALLYTAYKYEEFIKDNIEAAELYRGIGRSDYDVSCIANALDGCILNEDKHLADSIISNNRDRLSSDQSVGPLFPSYMLSYVMTFGTKEEISKALKEYTSVNITDDWTKTGVALAYSKIGDLHNAKRFWNDVSDNPEVRNSLKYLSIKPFILEQEGDYAGALKAYRKVSVMLDSIHRNIFSHDLLFAKERHDMDKANLMKLHKRDRYIWLSLCMAFVLFIIAGYIYYRYRLSKAKSLLEAQENKRLQLEQENLKREN